MERMSSVPILSIGVNVIIDTMLNFDANEDVNVNIYAQCEWAFNNHNSSDILSR